MYAFYQTDSRTVWASNGCAKQTGSSRGCVRRRRRFDNSWSPLQTALLQLMFLFLNNSNHILMSRDVLFRCLSAGRVHANTHRSRVLAQGPLVLSPTRYELFFQGDHFMRFVGNTIQLGISDCMHFSLSIFHEVGVFIVALEKPFVYMHNRCTFSVSTFRQCKYKTRKLMIVDFC